QGRKKKKERKLRKNERRKKGRKEQDVIYCFPFSDTQHSDCPSLKQPAARIRHSSRIAEEKYYVSMTKKYRNKIKKEVPMTKSERAVEMHHHHHHLPPPSSTTQPPPKPTTPPLLHHPNQPNKSQQTHTKITQINPANYQYNPLPPPPIQTQHNPLPPSQIPHQNQNPPLHESKPTIISKNQTHRKNPYQNPSKNQTRLGAGAGASVGVTHASVVW
ncbi:hypothetical protein SO802_022852, partial [Lithocarpus litseifolius]